MNLPGQDVLADDQDLPLDPALPLGTSGGEHVDGVAVVLGERRRLRMQRHRPARGDVAAHHGLGAVIDDAARHPTEMGERPQMAAEERAQVQAGGETAERVPGVGQHHVERVDITDPQRLGERSGFGAPVDLRLRPRRGLEPAVQRPAGLSQPELGADPRPGRGDIHLDPLIGTGEPVLGDEALMDHRAPQPDISGQPRIHHRRKMLDHPRLGTHPRRRGRRPTRTTQVLLHRPRVTPDLRGDLLQRRPSLVQGLETS